MTLTRHPLEERGAAYTELLALIKRRQSSLHPGERDTLTEAADALLFDEAGSEEPVREAQELLRGLVEADRWTEESAQDALRLLEAIGA